MDRSKTAYFFDAEQKDNNGRKIEKKTLGLGMSTSR